MRGTIVMTCFVATLMIAFMFGSADARRNPQHSHHSRTNTTASVFDKENCKLKSETGVCRARFIKWFYDIETGVCRQFTYGGCGGNANNFKTKLSCLQACQDKRGSNTTTPCPVTRCRMYCADGFAIDSKGCETCFCKPPAKAGSGVVASNVTCSPIMCAMFCEHGFIKNANGCDVCSCNPPPSTVNCPQIECPERCANGYKTEKTGCMTCECKEVAPIRPRYGKCGNTQCLNECPNGRKKDSRGCDSCECKESAVKCRPMACSKKCSFGYQTNVSGCPLCACKSRRSSGRQNHRLGGDQDGVPAQIPVLPDAAEVPAQLPA